ncbi:hypothetical protein U9M48_024686 [Paspalum notatum var. saurae]|uniref:HAT C-terminal dimerisation domain-containing protein n=1 Tax=Paspalum notatum var. saurae TaxID=547442 RepID=A0AAQ3TP50_PASNO
MREPDPLAEAAAMSMEDDAMDDDYYAIAEADDEEWELEAQNEAEDTRRFILGSSAAAAIDVDGAGVGAGMGTQTRTGSTSPTGTATVSTSSNRSRRRGPTSKVWLDFEEVTEIHAGKEVRVSAICLHCKNTFSAKSSSGTGHFRRHLDLYPSKKEKDRHGRTQSLLKFNADGSVVHWEYSPSIARTELCRLIARMDLPLCFGESDAFQEYITNAHNAKFVKSSRQTTARDLIGLYNDRVEHLIDVLKNSVSSVALTSDIWSGKAKEDYISVVAHFVNSDWCLEKRLLGLKPIEVAHTGANIVERVEMVASDYGITDKIFAIVLDNTSSNKTAMDVLKPVFSGYIGSLMPKPARNEDDLAVVFLHQRCACHIINLIVKSCLKWLLPYLEDFMTAITFLNSSNQRIASYKQYCLSVGVRPRKFGVDTDVRWNSTYLMLKHLVPYQSTFSVWIETNHPRKEDGSFLLTPNHWAVAEKLLCFLQLFYDSTVALSGLSELSSYLDSVTEVKFGSDFNILNWWQHHNKTYPILSILAKDVLIVPVSTISSESTFSLASRVLEERRRRLTLDMDWELADLHKQHTVEKESKELEAAFEAMYLDDEGTSPGSKRKEQEGGNAADVGARKKDKGPANDPRQAQSGRTNEAHPESSRGKRA